MKKYFKEKKKKSFYAKWINPVLLLYGLFILLCGLSLIIVMAVVPYEEFEIALYITLPVALIAFLAGSAAMLFVVVPAFKKAQANKDFARYDFNPYTPTEKEEFYCEYHLLRYTVAASPFDDNTSLDFNTDEEAKEYLAQHFAQELLRVDELYCGTEKSPFFIGYYSQNKAGITIRIDKKTDGETTTLDLTERHCATFTEEGLKVGDRLYPYSAIEGQVVAAFNKDTDFYVNVRLLIFLQDKGYLSFEISSRIAEIVKRFNINIVNKDILDYILADPQHAFKQTALQLVLRKLK